MSLWRYLSFRCKAFHLHGIHSPFVYGLDLSLRKEISLKRKSNSIVNHPFLTKKQALHYTSLIAVLGPRQVIWVIGEQQDLFTLKEAQPPVEIVIEPIEKLHTIPRVAVERLFVFLDHCPDPSDHFVPYTFEPSIGQADDVLLFFGLQAGKSSQKKWDKYKLDPRSTACVDFYDWGVVFFRLEQNKEHFFISL